MIVRVRDEALSARDLGLCLAQISCLTPMKSNVQDRRTNL